MARPEAGVVEEISPGLRRILAPNPGPMTHWGTNTFIIGEGDVAIVDPGPADAGHLAAIFEATKGERISHILVTHAHNDHSPLSRELSARTDAPVYGFGPHHAGRSPTMQRLAETESIGGGEGVDVAFRPDFKVKDGDEISGVGWTVKVLHTPGHFAGHLAFRAEDWVLSGDHVMDWASSLVSPPDGDLSEFMATSERLRDLDTTAFHPAHGDQITEPQERLTWLINHRLARETAILSALDGLGKSLTQITQHVYDDIDPSMLPAAARNVFAHLIDLTSRNIAEADPELTITSRFRLK